MRQIIMSIVLSGKFVYRIWGRHAIDIDFIFFCVTIRIGFVRTIPSIHYCTNGNFCNHLIESYDDATAEEKNKNTYSISSSSSNTINGKRIVFLEYSFYVNFLLSPFPHRPAALVRNSKKKHVHLYRALRVGLNLIHDDTINRFHYEAGSG